MLYSQRPRLEDQIVVHLLDKRLTLKSLHVELDEEGSDLTSRAVYKAIHKLMDAGVLLKVGKYVFLDEEWRERVEEKLGGRRVAVLPAPGERESHTFLTIAHLDAFWTTVVLPIERIAPQEIFFYNPHNFWAYIPEREESETAYYKHFAKTGRHAFFTAGGETVADREFKRTYQDAHFQVDLRSIQALGRRDHVTVIGNMVISVRLSKRLSTQIDELYASEKGVAELLPALLRLCRAPGTIRFVLENNTRKAAKIRRILAKNFYFANIASEAGMV